ncbi:LysR family transcriptional regulator [Pectobacterium versatile]|uniref:LysR family transcriptional regulator n=1 Tax=Pectobacterium versatile TaxID=2488639 RepID=A0A855MKA3_9GAMM|nr:LysR family transcriptional regulator [Pectobacterium versatile]POY49768.1 LysR family transcriptional regulator [Pectobacterium versatile]QPK15720.1 LysR family transcriptional regulator [Pectobacterium versatile]GKW33298.1 transcriptional regulator [Pectobacterium carotovorum subsp. carotovorum]
MPVRPTTRLTRSDLADLNAFRAVERARSFTQAAVDLGITTSALSHSVRNLETRLGVRLLNRTSRTVSPTDAGAVLAKKLNIGFAEISSALDEINALRDRPAGRIRLNVLSDGARLIVGPLLPEFLKRYPEVEVDVTVDDRMVDIVAAGFDAGIRYGGTIPEDFVAIKLGQELKWVAVASPRYLYHRPEPMMPEDLLSHSCIQIRTGQGVIYKWEFRNGDRYREIDVPGQVCVGETIMGVELALAGAGITYCLEKRVENYLRSGELRVVLPDWSPVEPAMYLYYPGYRTVPQGLRELIEVLREGMNT